MRTKKSAQSSDTPRARSADASPKPLKPRKGAAAKATTTITGNADARTQGASATAQAHITRMLGEAQTKNDELTERVSRLLARLS